MHFLKLFPYFNSLKCLCKMHTSSIDSVLPIFTLCFVHLSFSQFPLLSPVPFHSRSSTSQLLSTMTIATTTLNSIHNFPQVNLLSVAHFCPFSPSILLSAIPSPPPSILPVIFVVGAFAFIGYAFSSSSSFSSFFLLLLLLLLSPPSSFHNPNDRQMKTFAQSLLPSHSHPSIGDIPSLSECTFPFPFPSSPIFILAFFFPSSFQPVGLIGGRLLLLAPVHFLLLQQSTHQFFFAFLPHLCAFCNSHH